MSLLPGEASPSFAQTGADPILDDSASELFSYLDEDAVDLASDAGQGAEAYEMQSHMASSARAAAAAASSSRMNPRRGSMRPMSSASTAVSFGTGMGAAMDDETFTPAEDLAVRSKFDRKLVLFVALLFMLSFLDRSNIGNARIAGMEDDLQTLPRREDWYEWCLTAFYLTYIAFEWMALLFRVVPAHILISCSVFAWGITASLQAVAISYPMLVGLRALLGIGEAAFTGIPFYMSFFFKREELAFRTAIFISAAPLATTFASTLAWLILQIAHLTPIAPWRLLFLIEGFPSVLAAVAAWSVLPDSPQTASYLTAREKQVARLRLGHAAAPQSSFFAPKKPTSGFRLMDLAPLFVDPVPWLTAAMFFLTNMAYSSLPVFLPKILVEMGNSPITSQALSAPPYLISFIIVLFTAHMSDRWRVRTVPLVFHALSSAAGYAILALAEPFKLPAILRYIAIYPAAIGFFNVVTLTIAWNINNQRSETRQGGAFAIMQLIGQCGPLVGTRLYPDRDAPYYTHGMQTCAVAMLAVAIIASVLRFYMKRQNNKMDAAQGSNSPVGEEEQGLVGSWKYTRDGASPFRYML